MKVLFEFLWNCSVDDFYWAVCFFVSGLGFLFGLFFTLAFDISHWVSRAGDKFFGITWDEWKAIFTRLKSLFTRHKK